MPISTLSCPQMLILLPLDGSRLTTMYLRRNDLHSQQRGYRLGLLAKDEVQLLLLTQAHLPGYGDAIWTEGLALVADVTFWQISWGPGIQGIWQTSGTGIILSNTQMCQGNAGKNVAVCYVPDLK